MNFASTPLCGVCGQHGSVNQARFLIAENDWEDKLTILEWNERMASRAGIKAACCIEHVEELVIHWITTGRLDYPFARTSYGAAGWRQTTPRVRVDLNGARPIGELAVHRESLERVLSENPQSMPLSSTPAIQIQVKGDRTAVSVPHVSFRTRSSPGNHDSTV